jgi:hypothetical protein
VVPGFIKRARERATDHEVALLELLVQRRNRDISRVTSTPALFALTKALNKAKMHREVEIVIHWLINQEFPSACPAAMLELMADAPDGDTDLQRMAVESMDYAKHPRAVSEHHAWNRRRTDGYKWAQLLAMPPVEVAYMFAVRAIEDEKESAWIKERLLVHIFPEATSPRQSGLRRKTQQHLTMSKGCHFLLSISLHATCTLEPNLEMSKSRHQYTRMLSCTGSHPQTDPHRR